MQLQCGQNMNYYSAIKGRSRRTGCICGRPNIQHILLLHGKP